LQGVELETKLIQNFEKNKSFNNFRIHAEILLIGGEIPIIGSGSV